jgi:hypothetical protein
MSYLVIPNEVFANDATIWVAAINENLNPAATVLEYGSNQVALNSGWSTFRTADGNFTINYQRVALHNLTQQTRYSLTLRVGSIRFRGGCLVQPIRLLSSCLALVSLRAKIRMATSVERT